MGLLSELLFFFVLRLAVTRVVSSGHINVQVNVLTKVSRMKESTNE